MLISEFIDRTGYVPSEREYHHVIEPAYMKHPYNKDVFCRDWLVEQLAELHRLLSAVESALKRGNPVTENALKDYAEFAKRCAVFSAKLAELVLKTNPIK